LNKPALQSNATTRPIVEPPGIVMIRFLLRFIGLCLLATAFVFLVYDGERSIVNQHATYTDLEQGWALVDQDHLTLTENWLKLKVAWAWDPYFQKLFEIPVWAILAVAAMILILLGRKKRPLIGYARN
jgi:hypothetical protein